MAWRAAGRNGLGRLNERLVRDPENQGLRAAMMGQLGRVLQTASGREVVNALASARTKVRLVPVPGAQPYDPHRLTFPNTRFRPDDFPSGRDGRGSGGQVLTDPRQEKALYSASQGDVWREGRQDVLLMHELVHAYRASAGRLKDKVRAQWSHFAADDDNRDAYWSELAEDAKAQGLRRRHQTSLEELDTVGLGLGVRANPNHPLRFLPGVSENWYRVERHLIGKHSAAGAVAGDRRMALRGAYGGWDASYAYPKGRLEAKLNATPWSRNQPWTDRGSEEDTET
jgi:hypothetical protein